MSKFDELFASIDATAPEPSPESLERDLRVLQGFIHDPTQIRGYVDFSRKMRLLKQKHGVTIDKSRWPFLYSRLTRKRRPIEDCGEDRLRVLVMEYLRLDHQLLQVLAKHQVNRKNSLPFELVTSWLFERHGWTEDLGDWSGMSHPPHMSLAKEQNYALIKQDLLDALSKEQNSSFS